MLLPFEKVENLSVKNYEKRYQNMDAGSCAMATEDVVPLWNPLYSPCIPLALRAAIELNIFKIISDSGANARLSLSEIASRIPTDNPKSLNVLENILRLLSVTSFLSSRPSTSAGQLGQERSYGLTEQSRILLGHKTGAPFSTFVMLGTEREMLERMYQLKDVVLDPERNNFGGKEGKNMFQVAQSNPRLGMLFSEAMSVSTLIVVKDVIKIYDGFNHMKELMDVAGGIGTGLTQIISAYPHIHGINFDLPNVIAQAPKHPAINYVAGDMFRSLPKAENIWMKWILHDWDAETCEKLLKNCREALPEEGKVIIVEYLMPEDLEDDYKAKDAIIMELHMTMMNLAGKERTRKEFEHLAKVSGFTATNFIPLSRGFYLIEFLKKTTTN